MSTHPPTPLPDDRRILLLDFPVRLYTALRTMRLYPPSNPQVQRSNDFVLKAFNALLEQGGDDSINIALSDQKILVCGEHLPEKDQERPQIQGLITLFNRLKIHSFTFQSTFASDDCVKFIQMLSSLLGQKTLTDPISTLLDNAEIGSIAIDAKRYVAIHEGEQVVREELIGSGLNISDEELANFVLGKTGRTDPLHTISPELVKELINRLPESTSPTQRPEGLAEAVIEVLQNLGKETNFSKRANDIEESASTLSGLDPALLAQLVASLPATPVADEMLSSTLHQLTPQQLNALIANFITQQTAQQGASPSGASLQTPTNASIDLTAFTRMLGHYEQLLNTEQQTQIAQQAGAQIASMEGLALGNVIAQKFKGLFGEQLYRQVITQVSDKLLDETVEHLTPQQLNRMIATLTSEIPLHIGKDNNPDFIPADDPVLQRLAHTRKGAEITKACAQNIDARQLLLNPDTTIAQLPDHLLQRLRKPEWSAPVLANAAQQVADPQDQASAPVDFAAFNRVLGHYEQLLNNEQQTQVAQQAGAQLASMEGVTLGNIIAQKFKGLFGEQLYRQVITQVSDQLLDETVEHLTPKQLNRMIATLTSDIPLHIGKDQDQDFKPADDSVLKRLANTRKGSEITKAIAQNIDAHFLQALPEEVAVLPERLTMRLQQPAWSAPVLVTAAQQSIDPTNYKNGKADFSSFERMLEKYDTLLNKETQLQVATQAGSRLATFDEKELGLILVQKYKNLFGDQLYQQVINQISDEKFEKIAHHFQAITEGRDDLPLELHDKDIEKAYKRLLQTVRGEKMRAIVAMNQERKELKEKEQQETIKGNLDHLLQGELGSLEKKENYQTLPETVTTLLKDGKEDMADNILMQLAGALQHQNPLVQTNTALALASIAEQLANIGQWSRLDKLLPALKLGLGLPIANEQSIHQTMVAIGGLANHYITVENYAQATATAHFIGSLSTKNPRTTGTNPHIRQQALETLNNLCSPPVLTDLLALYLHSDVQQKTAGRLLVAMGVPSAKFQLQQLMSNESRFERKRLLALITQTGNPAITILLEELHAESPWFVIRNIIRLLGEIGNPALLTVIQPFLGHTDLRVQQELINAGVKIGGENLKDFLLEALQTVADPLKIKVVNQIVPVGDERYVRSLTDLLESTKPFLGKDKNDLQLAICKTLGGIGSRRATTSLTRVMQSRKVLGIGGYSEEVRQAASLALDQIQTAAAAQKGQGAGEKEGLPEIEIHSQVAATNTATVTIEEKTETFPHAAQGKRDLAKGSLDDSTIVTAPADDFQTAGRSREQIDEIDSLAMGEVIRSNEIKIIEQEENAMSTEEDFGAWTTLAERLSSEEFQALFRACSERRYQSEETLVSQGDKNDALFFISQGSIKISHINGPREVFITSLHRGQFAGESFFAPSVWTVNMTALTSSKVYILPQTALTAWQENFPELRAKLNELYKTSNNTRSTLEKKGLERRRAQRFTLSRKIQVQPVTHLDTPVGRGFHADIIDISLGGLAFVIRISKQENARVLLGRRMQVVLPVGGKTEYLHLLGLVVSIQPCHVQENDFSVHFKFDHHMEQPELQTILG